MHLHRVPDVQAAEVTERDPPEPRGTHRAAQRPVGCRPRRDRRCSRRGCGRCSCRRGVAIRQQADILGPLSQQEIDRREHGKDENAHRRAGGTPAGLLDHVLHPRQQGHRADADAGKGEPHGQPAAANEPVRQEQRLAGIAETNAARADQHTDRQIEMPWLRRQRRQQQPAAHQRDAELHHPARTEAIHHAADQRTDGSRYHKAERERARGEATVPPELADDRRKEQRERGPRIDADRHGDEGHHNDQPAVEERKSYHRVSIFGRLGADCLVKITLAAAGSAVKDAASRCWRSRRRPEPRLPQSARPAAPSPATGSRSPAASVRRYAGLR